MRGSVISGYNRPYVIYGAWVYIAHVQCVQIDLHDHIYFWLSGYDMVAQLGVLGSIPGDGNWPKRAVVHCI